MGKPTALNEQQQYWTISRWLPKTNKLDLNKQLDGIFHSAYFTHSREQHENMNGIVLERSQVIRKSFHISETVLIQVDIERPKCQELQQIMIFNLKLWYRYTVKIMYWSLYQSVLKVDNEMQQPFDVVNRTN